MKYKIACLTTILLLLSLSCKEKTSDIPSPSNSVELVLPFTAIGLNNLTDFKSESINWKIADNAYADRFKENILTTSEGQGVLVNIPTEKEKAHLFTTFQHGDIEFECDVMLAKNSNSGLYFQGRYEVQLFDSWGVDTPNHADMGGIYQRWNSSNEAGQEGYEGKAPMTNAAKAPGLWQRLKVIFHAPKFDENGIKIKNAWFEKITLNGVIIHENVILSGPTRASVADNELPIDALMIQGDHGPVAFKNIKYKLYDNSKLSFEQLSLKTYENTNTLFPNIDSLEVSSESTTDTIALSTIANDNSQRIFKYDGQMIIPTAGDYLFDIKVNGGAALLIQGDTLISMNGNYNTDSLGLGKITLEKGPIPFTLIHNKHTPWRRGFEFFVEGPGIQNYSLQHPTTSSTNPVINKDFYIDVNDEPIAQRSFWMHKGEKRTHVISVGTPQKIHFAYDLASGSLLHVWNGEFMDARLMWQSRGEKQLGTPLGFVITSHGTPECAALEKDDAPWPLNSSENSNYKSLGYEIDGNGIPIFLSEINGSKIRSQLIPSTTTRGLKRSIEIDGNEELWFKVGEGEQIEKLADGTYIINDESFYIDFSDASVISPIIRHHDEKDELLVKIEAGKKNISYTIIW